MTTAAIIFCWIVSFFFNGIESGLMSIDPVRLRENVKRGVRAAVRLNRLLEHPERLLVSVLLITNAADIIALLLLSRHLVHRYGDAGFLFAVLIALPIYLIGLGLLPKALFRRFPFRALALLAGVLEFVSWLLWPLLELGRMLGALLLPPTKSRRLFAAREELKQITAQSEREGILTATERAMIHNVVDFRGVRVGEVMVPREKVVLLRPETPLNEAIALSASAGVERMPVLSADGQPRGLVNVLDLLLDREGANNLNPFVRRIVIANEDEPAYRIVQRLRAARLGLAAVLDHNQSFRGIVTIEDLVRRLVSSTEPRA